MFSDHHAINLKVEERWGKFPNTWKLINTLFKLIRGSKTKSQGKLRNTFNIHFSKLMKCTTPRMNLKVNNGLWVIVMCRYRFILDINTYIYLSGEVMHVCGHEIMINHCTFLSILLLTWNCSKKSYH